MLETHTRLAPSRGGALKLGKGGVGWAGVGNRASPAFGTDGLRTSDAFCFFVDRLVKRECGIQNDDGVGRGICRRPRLCSQCMYAACAGEQLEGALREDESTCVFVFLSLHLPSDEPLMHAFSGRQGYNQHHDIQCVSPILTRASPNFAVAPAYSQSLQPAPSPTLSTSPHARNSSGRAPSPSPPPHTYSAMRVRP